MKIKTKLFQFLCLILLFFQTSALFSQTDQWIIRYESGQSTNDVRMGFKLRLLNMIMEKTEETHGTYRIEFLVSPVNNMRAIDLMQTGEKLNVFIALTNRDWESNTIAIPIPIRRGILNYRLLLIHKSMREEFQSVSTLEELKSFTSGSKRGWSTTKILEDNGFAVETTNSYDSLFQMLNHNRFDFLPRGVNEVYDELASIGPQLENVMIEPNLALYIPGATFIFVSPRYPKLALRLREGLKMMVEDGSLAALTEEYFYDDIVKADLTNRKILHMENKDLSDMVPPQNSPLWIDINSY